MQSTSASSPKRTAQRAFTAGALDNDIPWYSDRTGHLGSTLRTGNVDAYQAGLARLVAHPRKLGDLASQLVAASLATYDQLYAKNGGERMRALATVDASGYTIVAAPLPEPPQYVWREVRTLQRDIMAVHKRPDVIAAREAEAGAKALYEAKVAATNPRGAASMALYEPYLQAQRRTGDLVQRLQTDALGEFADSYRHGRSFSGREVDSGVQISAPNPNYRAHAPAPQPRPQRVTHFLPHMYDLITVLGYSSNAVGGRDGLNRARSIMLDQPLVFASVYALENNLFATTARSGSLKRSAEALVAKLDAPARNILRAFAQLHNFAPAERIGATRKDVANSVVRYLQSEFDPAAGHAVTFRGSGDFVLSSEAMGLLQNCRKNGWS